MTTTVKVLRDRDVLAGIIDDLRQLGCTCNEVEVSQVSEDNVGVHYLKIGHENECPALGAQPTDN